MNRDSLSTSLPAPQGMSPWLLGFLGVLLLFGGAFFASAVLIEILTESKWVAYEPYARLFGVVVWAAVFPLCLRKGEHVFRVAGWLWNMQALKAGLFFAIITLPAFLALGSLFPSLRLANNALDLLATPTFPLLFVLNGFVTPLCEEALWRGTVWRRFEDRYAPNLVLVFTSAAFAFSHVLVDFSFARVPAIFLFGVGCGLARRKGGVAASWITHSACNCVSMLLVLFPGVLKSFERLF
jgi:membrane protease YdiL (CAAX protease family)